MIIIFNILLILAAPVNYIENPSDPVLMDAAQTARAEQCLALAHPAGSLDTFRSIQIFDHPIIEKRVARLKEDRILSDAELAQLDLAGQYVADAGGWAEYETGLVVVDFATNECLSDLTQMLFGVPVAGLYELSIKKIDGQLHASACRYKNVDGAAYRTVRDSVLRVIP